MSEQVSSEECVRFVPVAVEGMNGVTEVAIFPDRLEVTSAGHVHVFPFDVFAKRRLGTPLDWIRRLIGKRSEADTGEVGEREFCTMDRYFRFYTNPMLKIYTPRDHELPYGQSFCFRIYKVLLQGGYYTFDLS